VDEVDVVPATPTRSREETKAASRRRLLEAALELIETDGEAGLTTGRVAKEAGLAQPTFYVHFVDMADLLDSLLSEILGSWGAATIEARRLSRESPDRARFRDTFRIPIEALAAHPRALRVVLANRHDPTSTIGRWSAEVWGQHRDGLVADLRSGGFPSRSRRDRRRVEMVADGIMALTAELALGHVDGRYPDLDEAIDVLIAFSEGYLRLLPADPDAGR
jgi:AcrR family transcriptional regulator